MAYRNFGLSNRPALGATTRGGPHIARDGGARESIIPELAAAFFVAAFASVPVLSVWFFCALIDWEGVAESLIRLLDFG